MHVCSVCSASEATNSYTKARQPLPPFQHATMTVVHQQQHQSQVAALTKLQVGPALDCIDGCLVCLLPIANLSSEHHHSQTQHVLLLIASAAATRYICRMGFATHKRNHAAAWSMHQARQ